MFSLDDCDDYQADFVLATLLDGTSPSQPSTSAGAASAMDTQPSSVEQQHRRQPHKRTHSGHQHTMNSTKSPDIDQGADLEESVSIEQSRSTYQPTYSRTTSEPQAKGNVSYKRAQEFANEDFPSGSQFNTARGGSSKSLTHKSPAAAHVPPPPSAMDVDFMDIDQSLPRTSGVRHPTNTSSSGVDKSLRISASTTTEELMDALFGADNNTDVAEDERVFSKKRDHPDTSRQATEHRAIQSGDAWYDKEPVTSRVAALPDRERDVRHVFPDDFPFEGTGLCLVLVGIQILPKQVAIVLYEYFMGTGKFCPGKVSVTVLTVAFALVSMVSDNITSKVQPLSTSAKVTLSGEHSTQDSIINDSGFLPSTPPSKKVRLSHCCSALFVRLLSCVNSSREALFYLKWICLEIDKAEQKFLPQTQRMIVTNIPCTGLCLIHCVVKASHS